LGSNLKADAFEEDTILSERQTEEVKESLIKSFKYQRSKKKSCDFLRKIEENPLNLRKEFEINKFLERKENESCSAHIRKMIKARALAGKEKVIESMEDAEVRSKKNEIKMVLNQAENIKNLRLASKIIKKQFEIEAKRGNKYVDEFKALFSID
jgi:hypothetical protein